MAQCAESSASLQSESLPKSYTDLEHRTKESMEEENEFSKEVDQQNVESSNPIDPLNAVASSQLANQKVIATDIMAAIAPEQLQTIERGGTAGSTVIINFSNVIDVACTVTPKYNWSNKEIETSGMTRTVSELTHSSELTDSEGTIENVDDSIAIMPPRAQEIVDAACKCDSTDKLAPNTQQIIDVEFNADYSVITMPLNKQTCETDDTVVFETKDKHLTNVAVSIAVENQFITETSYLTAEGVSIPITSVTSSPEQVATSEQRKDQNAILNSNSLDFYHESKMHKDEQKRHASTTNKPVQGIVDCEDDSNDVFDEAHEEALLVGEIGQKSVQISFTTEDVEIQMQQKVSAEKLRSKDDENKLVQVFHETSQQKEFYKLIELKESCSVTNSVLNESKNTLNKDPMCKVSQIRPNKDCDKTGDTREMEQDAGASCILPQECDAPEVEENRVNTEELMQGATLLRHVRFPAGTLSKLKDVPALYYLQCLKCDKHVWSEEALKAHMNSHRKLHKGNIVRMHPNCTLTCHYCQKTFSHKCELEKHIQNIHQIEMSLSCTQQEQLPADIYKQKKPRICRKDRKEYRVTSTLRKPCIPCQPIIGPGRKRKGWHGSETLVDETTTKNDCLVLSSTIPSRKSTGLGMAAADVQEVSYPSSLCHKLKSNVQHPYRIISNTPSKRILSSSIPALFNAEDVHSTLVRDDLLSSTSSLMKCVSNHVKNVKGLAAKSIANESLIHSSNQKKCLKDQAARESISINNKINTAQVTPPVQVLPSNALQPLRIRKPEELMMSQRRAYNKFPPMAILEKNAEVHTGLPLPLTDNQKQTCHDTVTQFVVPDVNIAHAHQKRRMIPAQMAQVDCQGQQESPPDQQEKLNFDVQHRILEVEQRLKHLHQQQQLQPLQPRKLMLLGQLQAEYQRLLSLQPKLLPQGLETLNNDGQITGFQQHAATRNYPKTPQLLGKRRSQLKHPPKHQNSSAVQHSHKHLQPQQIQVDASEIVSKTNSIQDVILMKKMKKQGIASKYQLKEIASQAPLPGIHHNQIFQLLESEENVNTHVPSDSNSITNIIQLNLTSHASNVNLSGPQTYRSLSEVGSSGTLVYSSSPRVHMSSDLHAQQSQVQPSVLHAQPTGCNTLPPPMTLIQPAPVTHIQPPPWPHIQPSPGSHIRSPHGSHICPPSGSHICPTSGSHICPPSGSHICPPSGSHICPPSGSHICPPSGCHICPPSGSHMYPPSGSHICSPPGSHICSPPASHTCSPPGSHIQSATGLLKPWTPSVIPAEVGPEAWMTLASEPQPPARISQTEPSESDKVKFVAQYLRVESRVQTQEFQNQNFGVKVSQPWSYPQLLKSYPTVELQANPCGYQHQPGSSNISSSNSDMQKLAVLVKHSSSTHVQSSNHHTEGRQQIPSNDQIQIPSQNSQQAAPVHQQNSNELGNMLTLNSLVNSSNASSILLQPENNVSQHILAPQEHLQNVSLQPQNVSMQLQQHAELLRLQQGHLNQRQPNNTSYSNFSKQILHNSTLLSNVSQQGTAIDLRASTAAALGSGSGGFIPAPDQHVSPFIHLSGEDQSKHSQQLHQHQSKEQLQKNEPATEFIIGQTAPSISIQCPTRDAGPKAKVTPVPSVLPTELATDNQWQLQMESVHLLEPSQTLLPEQHQNMEVEATPVKTELEMGLRESLSPVEELQPDVACRVCSKVGEYHLHCCGDTYYCDRECQGIDWDNHEEHCTNF